MCGGGGGGGGGGWVGGGGELVVIGSRFAVTSGSSIRAIVFASNDLYLLT